MAQLKTKIELYLKANSKTWDGNKISLQDDGSGAYIKTWNIDGLSKPSDEQLTSYNSAATTEENNFKVRATRRNAYGNIGDQLDEIYKDIDAWKARIKSIKDANPKE
tara:strand:+ start:183 stop:503 length:321 start_codon:yes stop_codon:yes gene_type:complete